MIGEVVVVEESGKEDEVTCVHEQREFDILIRDPTFKSRLFYLVRPDIHKTTYNHLDQLQACDHHRDGAGNWKFDGFEGIVGVHNGVNQIIHDNEPSCGSSVFRIGVPCVQEHGDMMIPVQKDERLFPKYDEDGVAQLGNLGDDEQERPETGNTIALDEAWNAD